MINGIGGGCMASLQMSAMQGQMANPFDKVDSNGDGAIDKTEFSAFAVEMSEKTGRSVDVDQEMAEIDTDGDGLVNPEELEAGRPEGPPPGMMVGMKGGGGMQAPSGMSGPSETESSSSTDPLDTNGDGVVDAEEAKSGSSYYIQGYLSQLYSTLSQGSRSGSQLSLQA